MNLLHLDTATIIGLIVSVVIPLVSAFLARQHWPVELLGILTLAVSTADGFLTQWADHGSSWDWKSALGMSIGSFILAVVAHKGIWKTGTTEARLLAFPKPKTAQPGAAA